MNSAEEFGKLFGLYATEIFHKHKKEFMEWLESDEEEHDPISTPEERSDIMNSIQDIISDKGFWVAGYDDSDGVFLKILLMRSNKE